MVMPVHTCSSFSAGMVTTFVPKPCAIPTPPPPTHAAMGGRSAAAIHGAALPPAAADAWRAMLGIWAMVGHGGDGDRRSRGRDRDRDRRSRGGDRGQYADRSATKTMLVSAVPVADSKRNMLIIQERLRQRGLSRLLASWSAEGRRLSMINTACALHGAAKAGERLDTSAMDYLAAQIDGCPEQYGSQAIGNCMYSIV